MPQPLVRVPSRGTLKKYGLAKHEWCEILLRQGGVCAVCERVPTSGTMVIDHEHVPNWKRLAPEDRRRRVRGLLCRFCNSHCVGRFMTLAKARRVAAYLERYHSSRPEEFARPPRRRRKNRRKKR